ncbi:hypothetical protein AB0I16_30205 [Streptomyces sp. NPDC050703]|uniref:hypothetical protein n=1 Tax=Streptomyces sp. NPDC050703 TaxID=3157218 RepID=UPI00343D0D54
MLAERARRVAAAWDGSNASTAWREGYDPVAEEVQLPRGGLRSPADRKAFEDRNFVLRGTLAGSGPREGAITWSAGAASTRPLMDAGTAYRALARDRRGGGPHLTVTGAKLSTMRMATSRGPATVPAWAFELAGYASPLKRAAVTATTLPSPPTPPIKPAADVPGYPVDRLVETAADGRSVTVIALHGACDDGAVVKVLETSGSVVLSASVKGHRAEANCTKQARMRHVTVQLKRPVDDRLLLDAHTGRPIVSRGTGGTA